MTNDFKSYSELQSSVETFDSTKKDLLSNLDQVEKQLKQIANTRTLNGQLLSTWDSTLVDLTSKLDSCDGLLSNMGKSLDIFDTSTTDKKPATTYEMSESQLRQLRKALKMKADSVTKCCDVSKRVEAMNEEIISALSSANSAMSHSKVVALEDLDYTKAKIEKVGESLEKSKVDGNLKDVKALLKVFPSTDGPAQDATKNFANKSAELESLRSKCWFELFLYCDVLQFHIRSLFVFPRTVSDFNLRILSFYSRYFIRALDWMLEWCLLV